MARRKQEKGFWLFEMFAAIWRRLVRFFKESQSPEDLVESLEDKLAVVEDETFASAVKALKGRKGVVAEVGRLEAMLDQFMVARKRAVASNDLTKARYYDAQIQMYQPMLEKARAQLERMIDKDEIRRVAEFNIARYRLTLARAKGNVAEINMASLLEGQADMQEELLGLGGSRLDLWEVGELEKRAERDMTEVEARLELSGDMLRSGVLTDEAGAIELFGEPSEELVALMQQRDAGELKVEEGETGLDESLLDSMRPEN